VQRALKVAMELNLGQCKQVGIGHPELIHKIV
jgi:hypothetical protein